MKKIAKFEKISLKQFVSDWLDTFGNYDDNTLIEIYNNIKEMIQKYEIQGNITKVNFSTSLTTISLDDKLNITFSNDSNLEYKVSFLKGIINKNGNNLEGYIDMSIENPVYSKYD